MDEARKPAEMSPGSQTLPEALVTDLSGSGVPVPGVPAPGLPTSGIAAADAALSKPPRDVRWFFIGANGLRAGWGMLLFALTFIAANFAFRWPLHAFMQNLAQAAGYSKGHTPLAMPVGFALAMELLLAVGVVIATVVIALVERRPILAYGFQGRARTLRFVSGIFYGFLAISALVLVLWKAGLLSIDGQVLHGAPLWKDAAAWGVFFIIVAIFEEMLFRGYFQYALTRGIGFWWGALLIAFLFGFSHGSNDGETVVGLFSAALIGLVFCLSLWYTGSLWWALGFHAAWDWGESYFYGTSDSGMIVQGHLLAEHPTGKLLWSGGPTGPEGSLLVLPLVGIFALLMWLWWGRRGERPFRGYAWKPAPVPADTRASNV